MLLQKCLSFLNGLSYRNRISYTIHMKENSNAQNWKKKKLKFDEYYWSYEILGDMTTSKIIYGEKAAFIYIGIPHFPN